MKVQINVSAGELIDKVTILEIKLRRIKDPVKWTNCQREWKLLCNALQDVENEGGVLCSSPEGTRKLALYMELTNALRRVNTALWDIEDEIRDLERRKVAPLLESCMMLGVKHIVQDKLFYENARRFVELARSVYHQNDERCRLKKELDVVFGSELTEEKSYQEMK